MPSRLIKQALAGRCIRRPKDRLAAGRRATTVTAFRRNDGKVFVGALRAILRFSFSSLLRTDIAASYFCGSVQKQIRRGLLHKKFQPSRRYGIESSFRKD